MMGAEADLASAVRTWADKRQTRSNVAAVRAGDAVFEFPPIPDYTTLARQAVEAVGIHNLIRNRINALTQTLDQAGSVYDLAAAKDIEKAIACWAGATRELAAELDCFRSPLSAPSSVDGETASAIREFLDAARYARHSLSLTPGEAVAELSRIHQDGFRRGVTTEVLRRELLQGRVGADGGTAASRAG